MRDMLDWDAEDWEAARERILRMMVANMTREARADFIEKMLRAGYRMTDERRKALH